MPHVSIKLATGRSEQQKNQLVEAIVQDVVRVLNCGEDAVSVALEEIAPAEWTEKVYVPDIQGHWEKLSKKPGYDPFKK